MARPQKTGIDYFYFACDFFTNRKVRKIMKACGPQSVAILSCLLCNIYKQGYYMLWEGEESTFDISDQVGVSDGAVSELVRKAIDADFFSRKMFEKHKILTSAAVQEIYFDACKRREVIKYSQKYLLIDVSAYDNAVNVDRNPVNDNGGTQRKEEEIKEEESKGDSAGAPEQKNFKLLTETEFYDQLKPFVGTYKPEMLRAFYNHWSEKNAKGKMKFQLEPTWELSKRLIKWRDNDEKFNSSNRQHGNRGNHKNGTAADAGKSIVFDNA